MCPIKGLTENRRLIRIGKIHLGIKVEKLDSKTGEPVYNTRGEIITYPKATDYFVCPPEVQSVYGEKPDRLDVIIPVEDDEMWCHQYYRQYSRMWGLICKGTGETCNRKIDRQTGAIANRDTKDYVWKDMPCPGRECPDYQGKKCQETMNLQFLLPRVPGLGVWQIDTGSVNSIRNINDNAAMLRAVCDRVSWIPLSLTLEPKEVINPDDGKKKVVRCLNLRHDKGLLEILEARDKPRTTLLIPMPAEDGQPLDETPEEDVIEGEIALPFQPKKRGKKAAAEVEPEMVIDAETGEVITQDENLFGERENEAGAAIPAEATGAEETRGRERQQPAGAAPASPQYKRDPASIKTLNDLMRACFQDFKMQPAAVVKELGHKSQSEITEVPAECYKTIAAVKIQND
jgi:hypothetical protein